MLKTYLSTFFRKFKNERLFSLLNLGGLTFGLTTVLLITLFIRDELSYDQFHQQKDDIYVGYHLMGSNRVTSDRMAYGLGKQIKDEVPEVLKLAAYQSRDLMITAGGKTFLENRLAYVSEDFFEVFDFPILYGLNESNKSSVMVNYTAAEKYFGEATLAIGQTILVNERDEYVISGVLEQIPANSTIQFDFVLTGNQIFDERSQMDNEGGYFPAQNWFLMQEGFDQDAVQKKMQSIALNMPYKGRYESTQADQNIFLMPLNDLHLKGALDYSTNEKSDIRYVYLFSAIGLLVLIIAVINYTNLTTAQSIKRGKEVGLRKVIGASRAQILSYYLVESFSLVLVSSVLAFALTERLLPWANSLLDKQMELNYFSMEFFGLIIGITVIVGFLSGIYPALILSKAKPLHALGETKANSKSRLRKSLTVVQFFIAQLLIIATVIIQQQLHFIQTKNLGYDRELLMEVDLNNKLGENAQTFKNELLSIPGVEQVSMANAPISRSGIGEMSAEELGVEGDLSVLTEFFNGDEDFIETFGMELISGQMPNKDLRGILVSESAVEQFTWGTIEERYIVSRGEKIPVVGLVKDFHNESLKSVIRPSIISYNRREPRFAMIKLGGANVQQTVSQITDKWEALDTGRPIQFKFLDEAYNRQYKVEQRLGEMFLFFSGLAIVIAVLGLVGLSTFTIEQRLKEISLRRVLGARYKELFGLFAKGYASMALLGFLLAAPVVFYLIGGWLNQFVYRISPSIMSYSSAFLITFLLAMAIIIVQINRTSKRNPAEVLRNE